MFNISNYRPPILISACLAGYPTRYNGRILAMPSRIATLPVNHALILCPEVIGGLRIPRLPAHFINAQPGQEGIDLLNGHAYLVDSTGRNVSAAFIAGAKKVLKYAIANGVREAWLKDRSPSCAYDPNAINPLGGPRQGVLSALLITYGIKIVEFIA